MDADVFRDVRDRDGDFAVPLDADGVVSALLGKRLGA